MDDERQSDDDYAESDALIDDALAAGDPDAPAPARPIDRFHRSAAGSVIAAGMFGLRDALEGRPEKDEPAVVVDAPSKLHDGPVDVQLDFEHPERSRVVIRRPPESTPDPDAEVDT